MSVRGNTSLQFTQDQAMLMDVATEFCRNKSPIAVVRDNLENGPGYDESVWQEIIGLGWSGIALPESCGGAGLGLGALVPVVEAMGKTMLTTPLISTAIAGQLLQRAGGSGCEPVLADIAAGAAATVAWLEGGDWGDTRVATQIDANGTLSGRKRLVTDAEAAQFIIAPAMRAGERVLAIVRAEQLSQDAITPNTLIDQTRRSADVDLTGVVVAPEHIVSGPAVENALRDARLVGALLIAGEAVGTGSACLATIVEYLKTRKQFGKLIGSYQALKHPTVDILLQVDSSRSLVYHAATLVQGGVLDKDAEVACRMAKAMATETLCYAGDRAVQFHGGMGFTYECDAQLYIRRAQWSQQQFGDARHHRKVLASLLLD
ncbi:MAG: acyl-CoA/acyl-ACP dehydrogenase [Gammaproteobacteria bacterium]|nr:acyl-CoA/acyl-ACP dehydrogenase [Gammaproteobacteria bacterium]